MRTESKTERKAAIRKMKNKLSFLSLPLYCVILVCLDLAFRYFYRTSTTLLWDSTPLLFTLGWSLLFTAVAGLLPHRGGKIWIIATGVAAVLLTVVHAVMFHMFGNFFSMQDLMYTGDGMKFFSFSYLKVRKGLLCCDILAVVGFVTAAMLLPKKTTKKKKLLYLVPAAVGMVLLISMHTTLQLPEEHEVMTWAVAKEEEETQETVRQRLYTEFINVNDCMYLCGIHHYMIRNLDLTLNPIYKMDAQEATREIETFAQDRVVVQSDLTGTMEGKNLIVVMLESIDTVFLTPEFMPELWAVQQDSINFTNHYSPGYITAATFGTEFLTMSGQIPSQSGGSTDVYTDNTFAYSLPQLFRNEGYRVNSFHSADAVIYNRGEIHRNLGFEKYHSHTDMGMDDYMLDSQLIRGFDQMVSDEPFFSFIITYSGHGPYDGSMPTIAQSHLTAAEEAVAASGITGSADNMQEFTTAVAHAMETDAFVGSLMDELEKGGYLEDTVVIFYADHFGKYLTDVEFLMDLKGVDNRNMLSNTPFFIYAADLEPRQIDTVVSTVDIYPTICNLFALDVDLRYFVGEDALAERDGLVYWPDYSWYDGQTYQDGGTASGPISDTVRQRLNVAWNSVIYDYFGMQEEPS